MEHPQNSKGRVTGGEAQVLTLTPPKAPKPPKVLSSVPATFPYAEALSELESQCPDYVETERWRQCLIDAQRFLAEWGEMAATLGWSSRDLFGLHQVPPQSAASYQRLSRYDATGLIWLLQGHPVVALTKDEAAIQRNGAVVVYRKDRKPAFGPLGDSLDDIGPSISEEPQ